MDNTSLSDVDALATPEDPMVAVRYAGFWIRVGAAVLDFVVMIPLVVSTFFVSHLAAYLAINLVAIAYKPCLEKLFGATVGKLLVGLRVVTEEARGLNWTSALLRASFAILASVPSVLMGMKLREAGISTTDFTAMGEFQMQNQTLQYISWGTSALWIIAALVVAFHPRKRGLHDMLADTFVVYKETLPASSR